MNKIMLLTSLAVGLSMAPISSQGVTIYSEDFEGYVPDTKIPQGGRSDWSNIQPESILVCHEDGTGFFPDSGSKQYGKLSIENGSGHINAASVPFMGVLQGQFSLQFYAPSNALNSQSGWALRLGAWTANDATMFSVFFDDGQLKLGTGQYVNAGSTIAEYKYDRMNQLDLVFNNDQSDFNYTSGSVGPQKMDVYLNGMLVGDDLPGLGNYPGSEVKKFDFVAKGAPFDGSLYLGKIVIDTEVKLP